MSRRDFHASSMNLPVPDSLLRDVRAVESLVADHTPARERLERRLGPDLSRRLLRGRFPSTGRSAA
jgi:hypothetical protein